MFTQHPRRSPSRRAEDASDNTSYWTGDGGIPRSAQHENVSIAIYDPAYEGDGGVGSGAYSFTYEDYTHAYFPTEHFDEVVAARRLDHRPQGRRLHRPVVGPAHRVARSTPRASSPTT